MHITVKDSDIGGIIEDSRYYDYDDTYEYTLTLEEIHEI